MLLGQGGPYGGRPRGQPEGWTLAAQTGGQWAATRAVKCWPRARAAPDVSSARLPRFWLLGSGQLGSRLGSSNDSALDPCWCWWGRLKGRGGTTRLPPAISDAANQAEPPPLPCTPSGVCPAARPGPGGIWQAAGEGEFGRGREAEAGNTQKKKRSAHLPAPRACRIPRPLSSARLSSTACAPSRPSSHATFPFFPLRAVSGAPPPRPPAAWPSRPEPACGRLWPGDALVPAGGEQLQRLQRRIAPRLGIR